VRSPLNSALYRFLAAKVEGVRSSGVIQDNKLVDLAAAVFTGIGLCLLDLSNHPTFLIPLTLKDILQSVSIRVGYFVLIALLVSLWNHKLSARWGWVAIATLGVAVIAAVDEVLLKAYEPEPDFFAEFSTFPVGIILYIMPPHADYAPTDD
jgi:ABC-type glucose/galactose transport system permease subunit